MTFLEEDKPHDECGVFGILGVPNAPELTYLGLYALQHRGQESAGIAASDGSEFTSHHGMGLVVNVFQNGEQLKLRGHIAIGHNRYSTAGSSSLRNAQPLIREYKRGPIAISHNGNLVNAPRIRSDLQDSGSIFTCSSDTEVLAHLLARSRQKLLEDRIIDALAEVRGAYSVLFMGRSVLIGARDSYGFRPLWIGRYKDAYVLTSETCALDVIGAEPIREVDPGEIVVITEDGMQSIQFEHNPKQAMCIFEYIYLARPDSIIFGDIVNRPRREFGRELAREHPTDADIVISVPDSANIAAMGYSEESGIRFDFGLNRNHYVGRTFIQPSQTMRERSVDIKLNPIRDVVEGKRVVVVEDSIMRGTNARRIVKLLRRRGKAKEVHFRVSSPRNCYPCFYGIDTPTRQELIASTHTTEEIRKYIEADSLGYLSIEGMLRCVKRPQDFCTACFDGNYPIEFSGQNTQQLSIEFTKGRNRG